jgi:hypothetical protein
MISKTLVGLVNGADTGDRVIIGDCGQDPRLAFIGIMIKDAEVINRRLDRDSIKKLHEWTADWLEEHPE